MIDPLAQFRVIRLLPLQVGSFDFSLTNSALFMILATVLSCVSLGFHQRHRIPTRGQYLAESVLSFIHQTLDTHVGPQGRPYTAYVLTVFMFILMGNLLGMIPYGFTITSHFIVTLTLALLVFISVTCIGICRHKWRFLTLFYPQGTPLYLAPLLIPIEILSYFTRPLSLSVRLFANMVAGHIMLKIFAGFVAIFLGSSFLSLIPMAIGPFCLTVCMIGFEVMVAVLQAYVFTVLTCLYLSDAINLH